MPSTKSPFSKPVKKCFIAPEGKIIGAADYNALEDRIIANLSEDKNKCSIFTDNLDGHTLNALGYYPDRVRKVMPLTGNLVEDTKTFFALVESKVLDAVNIRQDGKGITFGLSYGAFPPKIASMLGISVQAAQELFNNYHNVLYPGITRYREEYVLQTAEENGELHLGLGFTIATDDARKDIRTLANGTCQFWSILTAIAINKFHQYIDEKGYEDRVKVVSTIYDSIYVEMDDDVEIIQWVNNTLIEIMLKNFMHDQKIPNTAELDIGYDWATMETLPNNASKKQIKTAIKEVKSK